MPAWLLLLAALAWAGTPALADGSTPFISAQTTVTLISDAASVAPGQSFHLGLREQIAPGWHTYWSNPGDAGEAPDLRLILPAGATAGPLGFPAPQAIPYGPLVNFGYTDEVLLPISVTPPANLRAGDRFEVQAEADWLVCKDICIPEQARFALSLPVEASARPAQATRAIFAAALSSLPRPSPWPAQAGFAGDSGRLQVRGDLLTPQTVDSAFFFPAEPGIIDHAAPQPVKVANGSLDLTMWRGKGELPQRLDGVLAITDAAGSRSSYLIDAPLGPVPTSPSSSSLPLWQAGLFAALGGLLLNLMPCVFPILAMKTVGMAGLCGNDAQRVRGHAFAYACGVLASFLALGGLLIILKAIGLVAGWGFQFTSPWVVALMAWLMLGIGLNLSGVFEIVGPAGAGGSMGAKRGHAGSFATGCLAVLVATPCSAPFMAAAIGAAFLMPPAATLAVFAMMALGMALPYVLLACVPRAAGWLPKPGIWMVRLKQILAFPMYAAAVWLIWVLAVQTGAGGVGLALSGALLIGFAAWALGLSQASGRRTGTIAKLGGAAALLASLALLPALAPAGSLDASGKASDPGSWSAGRVAELQAKRQPVFVDVTAAWCITCKVNEKVALDASRTQAAFQSADVALLQADWTSGDPAITALLQEHGREGVPLYLLYPAAGGDPVVLPQILTPSIVIDALRDAGLTEPKQGRGDDASGT